MSFRLRAFRAPRAAALALAAGLLAGCAVPPAGVSEPSASADVGQSPWAQASRLIAGLPPSQWAHHALPGKVPTRFSYVRIDGRDALSARSEASASLVRMPVEVPGEQLARLQFSWKVASLIEEADMAVRSKDDAPVRVILAFDGDRSRLSARDLAMSELARALTGEELPYATLMYVWCNRRPVDSVIHNPRTDRIRKLVVESGPGELGRWRDYERDIQADFERAFGEKPGRLVGIAIMSDSDNTRAQGRAWYGPVRLVTKGESP